MTNSQRSDCCIADPSNFVLFLLLLLVSLAVRNMSVLASMGAADEAAHYNSVLLAFRNYRNGFASELDRRRSHFARLPASVQKRLPVSAGAARIAALEAAADANQKFFDELVAAQDAEAFGMRCSASSGSVAEARLPVAQVHPLAASKVRSTLAQLCRDWSSEGAIERAACYGPVLAELLARLPPRAESSDSIPPRVLVPGCGTGRLVFDAVCAGYAAQGSEFSLQMLFASNLVLNGSDKAGQWTVHPWIHDPSNHATAVDMLRGVAIPDVCPASALASVGNAAGVFAGGDKGCGGVFLGDFSMAGGDFLSAYAGAEHEGAWDAILSVFFLDTAPIVTDYLDVMRHTLRPGGLLINLGPLLYHWQAPDDGEKERDERYERSVELPYDDVRAAIASSGFRVIKEVRGLDMTYAANCRSLQRTVFSAVLTVCERYDGSKTDTVPEM